MKHMFWALAAAALLTRTLPAQDTAATAKILEAHALAQVLRPQGDPLALKEGGSLRAGDRVTTDSRGVVRMALPDGSEFAMMPNSDFTLRELGDKGAGGGVFRLLRGMLQGAVRRLELGQSLRIETESGVAAIKGTEYQVSAESSHMELKVLSGHVELSDVAGKTRLTVGPGEAALSYADHVGALRTMNRDEVDALRASFLVQVRQAQSDYLKKVKAAMAGH